MDILVGQQGSGKTFMCYQKINQTLSKNPYQKVIMLVPEQFNLEVQKELASLLAPGLLLVDVVSFRNLIVRALGDVPVIDDLERVMILKRLILQHKAELEYYTDSDGFLDKVNALLNICEQYDIDVEALNSSTTILNSKLTDIKNISVWFNKFVETKFYTAKSSLEALISTLQYTKQYEDTIILVDGFYTFTQAQLRVLLELYSQSKQMIITLPMDKIYNKDEVLNDNNVFYNFLYRIREKGITVPVLAGIMPVINGKQIERICKLSGTYLPPRFKSIVDKFGDDNEAMMQAGIAYASEQIIDLIANGVNGIHLYTMNKPSIARDIKNNIDKILEMENKN